ncbi:hypothetical protein [Hathewaya massiliensis]|uniref:hypothetical protein n=1 Tax=Hathewaya massiliensis TaxID=1964382 RepID=UPI001158CD87|nr:hypothetical protein [Hathewaya massiliensis]
MVKILAEKVSKRIYNVIDKFCSGIILEDKLKIITETITLTAANMNKKMKKCNHYPIQHASIYLFNFSKH